MNDQVRDFEMKEDYSITNTTITTTSTLTRPSGDAQIRGLVCQENAPVAINVSQNLQLLPRLPSPSSRSEVTGAILAPLRAAINPQMYAGEDEMGSWLHDPIENFYNELLSSNLLTNAPPPPSIHVPPAPQFPSLEGVFPLFSRMGETTEPEQSSRFGQQLTVVDSNETPMFGPYVVGPAPIAGPGMGLPMPPGFGEGSSKGSVPPGFGLGSSKGKGAIEGGRTLSTTSSGSANSSASAGAATTHDTGGVVGASEAAMRKRKAKEIEQPFTTTITTRNQKAPIEFKDEKKQSLEASASKRSRAAEIHNLSERRRRDRINEKMKALQELIPRCNKTDKASMLEEAIEYVKSLKMQVQMMSMYGMAQMMHPGMQQYMSPVVRTPGPAFMPPLAPRFPMPPYSMRSVPTPPQLTLSQPSNNSADPTSPGTPYAIQSPGMPQIPNMADPYQQYMAYQQLQIQMLQMQMCLQNQPLSEPGSSKPGPSKSGGENEGDVD